MTFDTPIPRLRPVDTIPFEQDGRDYLLLRDPQGFAEQQIAVAVQALPILARFDGTHTVRDIARMVRDEHQLEVTDQQVHDIARMLEQAQLLLSEGFLEHRQHVEEGFRDLPVREPILTDGGYPGDPAELTALLRVYENAEPPDDFAPEKPKPGRKLRGWLAPHIDYHRGGKTYGRLYHQLRPYLPPASEGPLLIGVIGVAHAGGMEPLIATAKDFRTPLGLMRFDRPAMQLLKRRMGEGIVREEFVHKAEHSVEIQLPWLQHVLKDRDDVTFLPLLAGILDIPGPERSPASGSKLSKLLDTLREIEKQHDGPVLWVSSVDFAHIGPSFGDPSPVSDKDQARVERKDMVSLETVRDVDPERWWTTLAETDNARRVCGMAATYITMHLLKGSTGRILDYQQAVSDDRQTMVSHAAAVFQE